MYTNVDMYLHITWSTWSPVVLLNWKYINKIVFTRKK